MNQSILFPRQIGRLSYLVRYLLALIVGAVGSILIEVGKAPDATTKLIPTLIGTVILLFFLYYMFLHVLIARLRDLDRHAAFALLILVPIVNILFAFYLLFAPSRTSEPTPANLSKPIMFIGMGCAALFCVAAIALILIGSIAVDTCVYTGRQIPERFMTTIRSLDLLKDDEQIRYFYSDALFDIKDGFYFVTDKNLVLYSSEWEEPETIIPFDQIASLDAEYDDSFFVDTWVYITTHSGMEISFPVASEQGLDTKFVEAIKENLNIESGGRE